MFFVGEEGINEKMNEKNLKEREREREKLIKNLCIGEYCLPMHEKCIF